jgi:hypothetical protein
MKRFIPTNPNKYVGDLNSISYRSGWELYYMDKLDKSPVVAKWISEPKTLKITYLDPITKKVKTYWPDFFIQYVDNSLELIEIKPYKESQINPKSSMYDKLSTVRNAAKWRAADIFAKKIGARFQVITERSLFKGKR